MYNHKEYMKQWHNKNKEYDKQYEIDNKDKRAKQKHQYYLENKEWILKRNEQYTYTINGKIVRNKKQNKYYQTSKGKNLRAKWHRIMKCKRRQLGFIPLNKPFENCEGHHISENFIVYIPSEIHKSIWHSIWNWKNMNKINQLAFEYL